MPNLGGVFYFFLGQGDICAQLDWINLGKKMSAHVACSMKKAKSINLHWKWSHVGHQLWGWRISSKFAQKPQIFGSSSFFIHMTYYGKIANFIKFVIWPKWSWNEKLQIFFSYIANGIIHKLSNQENVVQLTSIFLIKSIW